MQPARATASKFFKPTQGLPAHLVLSPSSAGTNALNGLLPAKERRLADLSLQSHASILDLLQHFPNIIIKEEGHDCHSWGLEHDDELIQTPLRVAIALCQHGNGYAAAPDCSLHDFPGWIAWLERLLVHEGCDACLLQARMQEADKRFLDVGFGPPVGATMADEDIIPLALACSHSTRYLP